MSKTRSIKEIAREERKRLDNQVVVNGLTFRELFDNPYVLVLEKPDVTKMDIPEYKHYLAKYNELKAIRDRFIKLRELERERTVVKVEKQADTSSMAIVKERTIKEDNEQQYLDYLEDVEERAAHQADVAEQQRLQDEEDERLLQLQLEDDQRIQDEIEARRVADQEFQDQEEDDYERFQEELATIIVAEEEVYYY